MKLEVGQFVRTKDGKIGKYFGEKAYVGNVNRIVYQMPEK